MNLQATASIRPLLGCLLLLSRVRSELMEKTSELRHLFVTIFLHNFSICMVIPSITDVTMSALCPGRDHCSIAIYFTGFQQAMIGLGTLVVIPWIGNLSDRYGRKSLLTIPLSLTIIPLGILACSRRTEFFYAYYATKTLTAMLCEGSAQCLALAYIADNVPEGRRASTFGILSGIVSASYVCGTLSARFLSTSLSFEVAVTVAVLALVYMKIFLQDSIADPSQYAPIISSGKLTSNVSKIDGQSTETNDRLFQTTPSWEDTASLLRTSWTLTQAAMVAFLSNLADVGLHSSLMYFLKARFHFNKNNFADLMVISGVAGTASQLLLMPMLAPLLGEATLLSVGLLFSCIHMLIYGIAWASWVPYVAAMCSILFFLAQPCIRSIVSKQVSAYEQGKAQGCITGISSCANVVSLLVFSPLTAWFLSDRAPFNFPGFSIICIGFTSMVSFILSMMMRVSPPISERLPIRLN